MTAGEIPAVPALDEATIAKIRSLAETLRTDLELHGAWSWTGDSKWGGYDLRTRGHGGQFVLSFARKGMYGAQPTFRARREGDDWGYLVKADDIAIHEVCREATDRKDPRLYRHAVVGFRSPVADWMETVTPDVVLALLSLIPAAVTR